MCTKKYEHMKVGGVRIKEMKLYEDRIIRLRSLTKWDVTIDPMCG